MKKTLSMLLAGAMLAGTLPMVSAATAEPTTLKELMEQKSVAVPFNANVDVDADIEVREAGKTYQDGPLTVKEEKVEQLPTFDYKATLYMEAVRNAFTNYINKAEALIEANGGANKQALIDELDNLPVTGEFIVTIKNADEMIIPEYIKENNQQLTGFNDATKNAFEEVSRTYVGDTMTITIKVKDGITKKMLADNLDTYLADLTLECTGVAVDGFDTYELVGEITGYTYIGDDINTADVNEAIAKIDYKAVQKDGKNPDKDDEIDEIVKVSKTSDSTRPTGGGGGGSTTTKKINVITEVDGKEIDKVTATPPVTYNPYDLDTPTKELHIFNGWYNKATDEEVTGVATYTKDTVIYAKWISTGDINVNFVIDGKPAPANVNKEYSVKVPAEAILPAEDGTNIYLDKITPVIPGDRKFEGWFLDAEYTIPADAAILTNEDITLYGKTSKLDGGDILDMDNHYAYIIGYPDGLVRPEQNISREEVATIFFRLLTEDARNSLMKKTNDFADVDNTRWSNNAISTMAGYGTIKGYEDGTFKPGQAITRAEFVTMTARFYDLEDAEVTFTDVSGHWAEGYIASAAAKGWINGYEDGTFRPDQNITRAEAMTIVNHLLNRKVDANGLHADAVQWTDNEVADWFYYDVLEATNSHKYEDRAEGVLVEKWTECTENYDWSILEK